MYIYWSFKKEDHHHLGETWQTQPQSGDQGQQPQWLLLLTVQLLMWCHDNSTFSLWSSCQNTKPQCHHEKNIRHIPVEVTRTMLWASIAQNCPGHQKQRKPEYLPQPSRAQETWGMSPNTRGKGMRHRSLPNCSYIKRIYFPKYIL